MNVVKRNIYSTIKMQERSVSPDLFDPQASHINEKFSPEDTIDNEEWRGSHMNDIYHGKSPWDYYSPPISPSRNHTVLFEVPIPPGNNPKPHYTSNACHWNNDHVRMPFSHKNLFPIKEGNENVLKPRWDLIQLALLRQIKNSHELEEAISSYNSKMSHCEALHYFLNESLCEEESDMFFKLLLPKIIQLALQLPELIPSPIPLLKQGKSQSISLSQLQVASLVANGFLCTFPWRKDMANYPGLNFYNLYRCCGRNNEDTSSVSEKLKCIMHYFRRVTDNPPTGVITFERRYSQKSHLPRWDRLENKIADAKLHVSSSGTIEEAGKGLLQVDFANCYVGGGVLGRGCVQEEIRFVTWPELLVSRLFTEKLESTEALHVIGIECFSKYEGYAETFRWAGDYQDATPRDTSGRKRTSLVAIDALFYHKPSLQFCPSRMIRELNKAYVGYKGHTNMNMNNSNSDDCNDRSHLPAVATGNWGCGAFRGNVRLKALLQMMVCSAAGRDIVYYTFGDARLRDLLHSIHNFFQNNSVTISQLWRYLCRFNEAQLHPKQLYPFIQQAHLDSITLKPLKQEIGNHSRNNKTPQKNLKDNNVDTKVKDNEELFIEEFSSNDIINSSQPSDFDLPKNYVSESLTKKTKINRNENELKKNHQSLKSFLYSSDEDESQDNPGTSITFIDSINNFVKSNNKDKSTDLELSQEENGSEKSGNDGCEKMDCDIIEDSEEEEEIVQTKKVPTPTKVIKSTPSKSSKMVAKNTERKITEFFKAPTK